MKTKHQREQLIQAVRVSTTSLPSFQFNQLLVYLNKMFSLFVMKEMLMLRYHQVHKKVLIEVVHGLLLAIAAIADPTLGK